MLQLEGDQSVLRSQGMDNGVGQLGRVYACRSWGDQRGLGICYIESIQAVYTNGDGEIRVQPHELGCGLGKIWGKQGGDGGGESSTRRRRRGFLEPAVRLFHGSEWILALRLVPLRYFAKYTF